MQCIFEMIIQFTHRGFVGNTDLYFVSVSRKSMLYQGFGEQKPQKQKEVFSRQKAEGNRSGSLHRYQKAEIPRALKIFRIIVYLVLPATIIIGIMMFLEFTAP